MENYDEFKVNVGIASDSEGELQKQADIYAQSWEAAKKRVKASAEGIYEALLNDDFFIDMNNGFSSVLDSIGLVIEGMGGLKGVLPLITLLMNNLFGTKLANSIDLIIAKITGGQHALERLREEAAQRYISTFDTTSNGATRAEESNIGQIGRIEAVSNLKDAYLQYSQTVSKLNPELQDQYRNELEKHATLVKETEELGKQVSLNERKSESLKQQATLQDNLKETLEKKENIVIKGDSKKDVDRVLSTIDNASKKALGQTGQKGTVGTIGPQVTNKFVKDGEEKEQVARSWDMDLDQRIATAKQLMQDYTIHVEQAANQQVVLNEAIHGTGLVGDTIQEVGTDFEKINGLTFENTIGNLEKVQGQLQSLQDLQTHGLQGSAIDKKMAELYGKEGAEQLKNYKEALNQTINGSREMQKQSNIMQQLEQKGLKNTQAYTNAQAAFNQAQSQATKGAQAMGIAINGEGEQVKGLSQILGQTNTDLDALKTALQAMGFGDDVFEKLNQAAKETGQSVYELAEQLLSGKLSLEQLNAVANKPLTIGQSLTGIGSDLSKIAMGIKAIKSLGQIWSDEDTSTGEKLLSTMMSMSMILPMLTSLKLKDNVISLAKGILVKKEIANTGATVVAKTAETAARGANTTAAKIEAMTIGSAMAVIIPYIAAIAAIGLAIAGLISILSSQKTTQEEANEAAERAATAAEQLKTRYDEVKQAFDDLKKSLEDHNDALEAIKDLTQGTLEWKQAIADANTNVLELISNYPELAQYITRGEGGVLQISKEGQEKVIEAQYQEVHSAQNLATMSKLNAQKANIEARQMAIDSGEDTAFFAVGSDDYKKLVHDLVDSENTLTPENIKETIQTGDYEAISFLAPEMSDENLSSLIESIQDDTLETRKNNLALETLNESMKIAHQDAVAQLYGDNQEVQDSKFTEAINALGAEERKKAYDKTRADVIAGAKDGEETEWSYDQGLWDYSLDAGEKAVKEYVQKVLKGSVDSISFDDWYEGGVEISYTDDQGNRQTGVHVTYEAYGEMKGQEAGDKAAKDAVEQALKDAESLGKTDAGALALKALGTGTLMDVALGDLYNTKEELLVAMGIESMDSLTEGQQLVIDAYLKALENQKAEMSEIESDMSIASQKVKMVSREAWENVKNSLDTEGYRGFVNNLNRITAQFGSKIGEQYVATIQSFINDNDINDPEFLNRLQQIDIVAEDSGEQIKALAEEFKLSDEQTISLITTLDQFAISATRTSEQIGNMIASLEKLTKDLKIGDIIESEEFAEIFKVIGYEANNFFTKMADGTYLLTAEAESFYQRLQDWSINNALETRREIDKVRQQFLTRYNKDITSQGYLEDLKNSSTVGVRREDSSFQLLLAAGIDLEKAGLTKTDTGGYLLDDAYIAAVEKAQELYNAAGEAIASVRDSVVELDALLKEETITQDEYNANIRRLATLYPDVRDELNAYNKAVQIYTKDSWQARRAQTELTKAVRQAQTDEAAVNILNAANAMKDLIKGTDDYIQKLEEQAKAFNSVFGTSVDTNFVEQYQKEITEWAAGGEGAEDIGQYLSLVAKVNEIQWTEIISKTQNATGIISALINAAGGTIVVDGKADLTSMINAMLDAGATGKEVAEFLNALSATNIEFGGNFISTQMPDFKDEPDQWIKWFNSIRGGIQSVKATLPTGLGTPDMETVNSRLDSSGSGSGGGSKKKSVEEEVERYHEISRELAALERETKRLSDAKNEAFGQSKIDLIEAETKALEKELAVYEAMDEEVLNYLAQDKANIAQFGATFDERGNINNYDEMVADMVAKYNSGAISEEQYSDFTKYLDQYEETLDKWYDNQDKKTEKQREIIQNQIAKIDAKVEIDLELSQKEIEWIEYQLSKLEDTAFAAAESIDLITGKVDQAMKDSETYQTQLQDLYAMAEENKAKGLYVETGGFNSDMKNSLNEATSNLLEVNKTMLDARKQIQQQFGIGFDEMNEKLDTQIARFDSYGAVFEHYTNILSLSGKSIKDAQLIIDLGNKSVENSIGKLESARQKQEALESSLATAQSQYDAALARGDSESAKYWEEEVEKITIAVEEGKESVLASFEEALQVAADNFAAAVEQVVAVFEASLTKFDSLDIAQDEYDKQKEIAERYLSANEQAYELSKLMRTINGEIAKTDNLAAKTKLRDVLEEINEIQANNAELTKYDLDMLNAKYQLRLAEIALEEAQNAKNQVRLTQTAGGGWGYVYTADQSKIDNAQQNYEDKLRDIQKLAEEHQAELSDAILENQKELSDALISLSEQQWESDEAYYAERDRLIAYYTEKDLHLQQEFDKAVRDSGKNYSDTLLSQITGAQTWEEGHNKLMESTEKAVKNVDKAYSDWKTQVSGAYDAAGTSLDGFKQQVELDSEVIIQKNNAIRDSVQEISDKYTAFLDGVGTKITTFQTKYGEEMSKIIDNNESVVTSVSDMLVEYTKAKKEFEDPIKTPEVPDTNPGSGSSGSGTGPSGPGGSQSYSATATLSELGLTATATSTESIDAAKKLAKENLISQIAKREYEYVRQYAGNDYMKKAYDEWVDELIAKIQISSFDTGGYTGSWGANGKFAMLHEKEIVLNQQDTANILASVEVVRSIAQQLDALSQYQRVFGISGLGHWPSAGAQPLEQNVHITADFPNVTDHNEIELALSNLINYSSQYINRYNK